VGFSRRPEDVVGHDFALVLADVGQRPESVDIADRPQTIGRAQVRVDGDPVRIFFDADRVESDSLHPRPSAGCDEYPVAPQFLSAFEFEHVVVSLAPRPGDIRREHELYALTLQYLAKRLT